jgi:ATP-binding cassette subfamily B protein
VVQGALAGLERIFEVLSLATDEEESGSHSSIEQGAASDGAATDGITAKTDGSMVEVNHVTFGYLEERPVLIDVSLRVKGGQHLAIVGRTGAGKSSLFHLLGGLYRPWRGTIRLQGHDPNRISSDERRRIVGAVPQIGWMFGGSVADNLTLGDKTYPQSAIEKAARISGADDFVNLLPAGYDTIIRDPGQGKGTQVSAGQRQLLALARALIGDPAILLLDEATAAVDGSTEAAFKHALRTQIEQRRGAVVTIAHRLSTAMEADEIVVMEEGRIVEAGPPDELLRKGGHFASLRELENAGWEW